MTAANNLPVDTPPFPLNTTFKYNSIACKTCPSFDASKQQCCIVFGSPIRKCVVSSIEAHFYDCQDQNILEIGYGRFNLAKNLIRRSGGTWTGIEPCRPESEIPEIGNGGYGLAADIPFSDNTFDKVFGVQSIEHWVERAAGIQESSYEDCIAEIHRALKPGGVLYQDTAVHFHGNEMFIMGDIERIRALFPADQWKNVQIEQWRKDYEPLERFTPSPKLQQNWPIEIISYTQEQVDEVSNRTIWMMVITAEKI